MNEESQQSASESSPAARIVTDGLPTIPAWLPHWLRLIEFSRRRGTWHAFGRQKFNHYFIVKKFDWWMLSVTLLSLCSAHTMDAGYFDLGKMSLSPKDKWCDRCQARIAARDQKAAMKAAKP